MCSGMSLGSMWNRGYSEFGIWIAEFGMRKPIESGFNRFTIYNLTGCTRAERRWKESTQ